jgi:hypothetical protein
VLAGVVAVALLFVEEDEGALPRRVAPKREVAARNAEVAPGADDEPEVEAAAVEEEAGPPVDWPDPPAAVPVAEVPELPVPDDPLLAVAVEVRFFPVRLPRSSGASSVKKLRACVTPVKRIVRWMVPR